MDCLNKIKAEVEIQPRGQLVLCDEQTAPGSGKTSARDRRLRTIIDLKVITKSLPVPFFSLYNLIRDSNFAVDVGTGQNNPIRTTR